MYIIYLAFDHAGRVYTNAAAPWSVALLATTESGRNPRGNFYGDSYDDEYDDDGRPTAGVSSATPSTFSHDGKEWFCVRDEACRIMATMIYGSRHQVTLENFHTQILGRAAFCYHDGAGFFEEETDAISFALMTNHMSHTEKAKIVKNLLFGKA